MIRLRSLIKYILPLLSGYLSSRFVYIYSKEPITSIVSFTISTILTYMALNHRISLLRRFKLIGLIIASNILLPHIRYILLLTSILLIYLGYRHHLYLHHLLISILTLMRLIKDVEWDTEE